MININPTLNYLFASLINNLSISGRIVQFKYYNNTNFLFSDLKPLNIKFTALIIYLCRFQHLLILFIMFLNIIILCLTIYIFLSSFDK